MRYTLTTDIAGRRPTDEQFVRDLCEKYGVPLQVFSVDLESTAKKRKQSLEEAGREIRRELFEKEMQSRNACKIALAHHENDNAETFLWNLCRGCGLHGLGGIRPVNGVYIRPLLGMTRGEIETFLQKRQQPYCTDATNLETDYTRNKLRHLVLPVLEEQINRQTIRHMNTTMEELRELDDYVEMQVEAAYQACVEKEQDENCLIRKEPLLQYPELLQNKVIFRCLAETAATQKNLGRVHVEDVRALLEKQPGRSLDLPARVRAVREYEGVRLKKIRYEGVRLKKIRYEKEQSVKDRYTEQNAVCLAIPGTTVLPEQNLKVTCRILEKNPLSEGTDIPQKTYTKWFDYDIIKKCLHIRTRQSGDWITVDGAGHRQKLKSWFVNEKIPYKQREEIPLIAEGNQILWILGYRMGSAYRISSETKRILQIDVEKMKSTEEKKNG
uniref:tRNA lysidine(34) synthetase TilS n=1 Tax=Mediterraneibacter glycyrrhizinilyticus TaxID=342942 RepID=UPI000ADBF545